VQYLLANPFSSRLRDLKRAEFNDFLKLTEEREPDFREVLTTANGIVNGAFFNPASRAETAIRHPQYLPTSSASGRNSSGGVASVPPGDDDELREAACGDRWAFAPSVRSSGGNPTEAADAFSGPDLDALLTYSFRPAAEYRPRKSILDQCYLWQSTRFEDPQGADEPLSWCPRVQRSRRPPRRYQVLPFFYTERWQLAVFDIAENVVMCYDTMWTSGSPNSTFVVS